MAIAQNAAAHDSTQAGRREIQQLLKESVSEGRKHPIQRAIEIPTIGQLFAGYRDELSAAKRAYADMKWSPIAPFWRAIRITDVDTPKLKEFVVWRKRHKNRDGDRVKSHTIHKDLIVIRQILKYAVEECHLTQLPLFPKAGKIVSNPRPWADAVRVEATPERLRKTDSGSLEKHCPSATHGSPR